MFQRKGKRASEMLSQARISCFLSPLPHPLLSQPTVGYKLGCLSLLCHACRLPTPRQPNLTTPSSLLSVSILLSLSPQINSSINWPGQILQCMQVKNNKLYHKGVLRYVFCSLAVWPMLRRWVCSGTCVQRKNSTTKEGRCLKVFQPLSSRVISKPPGIIKSTEKDQNNAFPEPQERRKTYTIIKCMYNVRL